MKATGHAQQDSAAATAGEQAATDEMLIDGRKRIKTIQDEFTARFPYLGLHFFSAEQMDKSNTGGAMTPYGGDLTLASVRAAKVPGNGEFKLSGRMHVGTLEADFRKHFGLLAQVCVQKDGKGYYTSAEQDAQSLQRFNEHCQSHGYDRVGYSGHRK